MQKRDLLRSRFLIMNYTEAFKHLRKDPIMKILIEKLGSQIDLYDRNDDDLARAFSNLIIEQQISFKAAITIKKRFFNLINGLSNKEILNLDNNKIQSVGISFRKVGYIKNIIQYFESSNFDFRKASDKEIEDELIQIKGIGKWTIEMFMIFILFRLNVFSKGDVALINSIKSNYNIIDLSNDQLNNLISKWSPHNTIASLILWKSIENRVFYDKD
ncbi:MAG: DNA-3-methyladenine glycosylase [Owenweeksia sp. TMED14]|nr:MAG: DNA-3-methyladenine glycosylase [Owenweeksia sp. TMED14]